MVQKDILKPYENCKPVLRLIALEMIDSGQRCAGKVG